MFKTTDSHEQLINMKVYVKLSQYFTKANQMIQKVIICMTHKRFQNCWISVDVVQGTHRRQR